jgi:2-C-methyl-D-erythritol 4-phosphate cytidylyltransferase
MNWLIVVAGGSGTRKKASKNKIFLKINQKPILFWTLKSFQESSIIDKIIISSKDEDRPLIKKIVNKYNFSKVVGYSQGGSLRQDTVFNALQFIKNKCRSTDIIGVHNAANPFVSVDEIKSVYQAAKKFGSALLASPSTDTIKIVNKDGFVSDTPNRQSCYCAQTPQVAKFKTLYSSYQNIYKKNLVTTDDSQVLELSGFNPKIVVCSTDNFKITYPKDLLLAKNFFKNKK